MEIIKLGSIVSISHLQDDDALIGGDGFIKNSVILKGMSPLHKANTKDFTISYYNQMNMPNCLFVVCPRTSSNVKKQETEQLFASKQKGFAQTGDDVTDQKSDVTPAQSQIKSLAHSVPPLLSEKEVKSFSIALFGEFESDVEVYTKEKGNPLKYDQPIQLLHLASYRWLCSLQDKEAKFENQNFRLSLSDYASDATLFKIVPSFKYQKEGDQIVYSSEIVKIIRMYPLLGKPAYLHCSGEIPSKAIKDDINMLHIPQAGKIQKREINASLEEQTSWKINLFSSEMPVTGDLVWIHHSESYSQLAIDYEQDLNRAKISVFQSDPSELSFDNYSGNAYSLWIIENEDYKFGGPFLYSNGYRLKHFHTGLYLACVRNIPMDMEQVKNDPYGKKKITIPKSKRVPATFSLQVVPNKDAIFTFEPLKSVEKKEIGSDFIQIRSQSQNKYIDVVSKYHPEGDILKPVILNKKNEHAVFKIFKASRSETQEVLFLDSCTKQLRKYLHYIRLPFKFEQNQQIQQMQDDQELLKVKNKKLKTAVKCIQILDEFVKQKIFNSSPQQKFGFISPNRQRLLRDQHFLKLLLQILTTTVDKQDLEAWCNKKSSQKVEQQQQILTANTRRKNASGISEKEKQELSISKVEVCNAIFILLHTSVINNSQNQLYLFDCLPTYQFYCKYLQTAINFVIEMVRSNQRILLNLCNNLRIEFDYLKNEEIVDDMSKKVKVLINFYEKDAGVHQDTAIPFKVHDRIITRPINIVQYFFNLLIDDLAFNKELYIRFLRNICRYKQSAISINQEMLFKLYKKFSKKTNILSIEMENGKIINKDPIYQQELLQFYAEAAYGRNYLWKEELCPQFKQDFLINQIWEASQDQGVKEDRLRSNWCKLSRSLYIDQQPFHQLIVPNFCRLFHECPIEKDIQENEIKKQFQLKKMFGFLKGKKDNILKAIDNSISQDILNDELIYNASEQILTMLQLNIMPKRYYKKIVRYIAEMFVYDRKNLNYLRAAVKSYQKTVEERIKGKGKVTNMLSDMLKINKEEPKEVVEEEEEDQNLYDQPKLFLNPIMRGFMTMSNKLEGMISLPKSQQEIEFKLKVCSILDHFLDRRQDFLISNILVFFQKYEYQDDDLSDEEEDQTEKAGPKIFDNNFKTLIPPVARTGINDIDEPQEPVQDVFQIQIKKPPTFINYIKHHNVTSFEEFEEIDQYLSEAQKDIKQDHLKENQVASLFPYLMSTYYLVKDQVLEERCLNVIMRVFNQREELKENIKKVQIIFDDDKTAVYGFVERNFKHLSIIAEQTEIWLTKFKEGHQAEELGKCKQIIGQLSKCIRKNVQVDKEELIIEEVNELQFDEEKQSIMNFLKVHELVINLIQNGMSHFIDALMQDTMPRERKEELQQLFENAFTFLIYFCTNNKTNQLLLHSFIEVILQYVQYDVGQSKLIIEIYRDNPRLLNTGSKFLLHRIVEVIEKEGRQAKYIDILINLMILSEKYILENQLLILNTFLPMRDLNETELRLLYCEGSKHKDLRFYLDDQFIQQEENLLIKLAAVDWKDSYRDEPFWYHEKVLQMLLQTALIDSSVRIYDPNVSQNEGFNISVFKLKKAIKSSYLIEILRQEDNMVEIQQKGVQFMSLLTMQVGNLQEDQFDKREGFTIIKPIACEFLRLVHIASEKNNAQECQFSQQSRSFILFIEFEIKKLDAINQSLNYQSSYVIYIVEYVIPLIITYHQRILSVAQGDVKKAIQTFSVSFAKALCKSLYQQLLKRSQLILISKLREYYPNEYYEPAFLQDNPACILHLEEQIEYKKEDIIFQQPIEELQKSSVQKKSQHKSGNMFSSLGVNLNINISLNSKKSKHKRQDMKPTQYELQWIKFVNEMTKSQKMEEQIELEKQALADAIIGVDKLVTEPCDIKPKLESILKKFINFLQTAVLQQENKGTIIILLKIMSKIIEKHDTDEEKKVHYQKLLDNLGATRMVLNVITDYAKLLSNEMLFYMISFINVLMAGGNTQVQSNIYTFCQTQQKSEIMFQTFAKYLERASNQSNEENEDEEEVEIQKKIVNSILKFFQNCAEGHYIDMQNYIRYQFNSRASKDLINLVADLFKNYERTAQNFGNLLSCMDTLNELVQGPCPENQIAVADSKFFDVVQEMFPLRKMQTGPVKQQTTKRVAQKKRGSQVQAVQQLSRGMKAQLQNKILVLVLSLLEQREIRGKNSIIKRVMRVLPMNVLERHLSKIYKKWFKKYQGDYNMSAFDHIKMDAVQMQEDDPSNRDCEVIIQNGFYIMFLICFYMESDEEIESQFLLYNKQYLRTQNKENSLFDPNSTIGQLFALGMELYEMSLLKTQQMLMDITRKKQGEEEAQLEQQRIKQEEKKKRVKKAFMFFRSHTAHIEVVREDQIELVFFPLLPFSKLNKDEKSLFQQTVDRSSAKSKVQDLLEKSPEFIQIMRHEEEMRRFYKQYKIVGFFANYIQLWKDLAFYLTLVINIIILGSFSHKSDPEKSDSIINDEALQQYVFFRKDEWTQSDTQRLINALGTAMTVCSLFVVVFVLAKIAPLIIKRALERKPVFEGQVGTIKLLLNWLAKFFFVLFYCLQDFSLVYYLGYGTLAIIGTLIHPFFFCFHLTVILIRYPTLRNVVRAVTMPWQQLILTLLLIIIITYVFTLIAFYALQDSFGLDCKEVYLCFLQIFDMNFKVPGGIGGSITNNNPSPIYEVFRYLYDQLNNILLVIIMVSIAFGIIIDTFGQLREEENAMTADIRDKCFICGQENIIFERSSDGSTGGFKNHIRQNHYMWNYLYYIAYLQWKDPQDYSGIESFVDKKIIDIDLSWIPFGRARELQRGEDEQEKQFKALDQSNENVLQLCDHSKDIVNALKLKKEQKKKHEKLNSQPSVLKDPLRSQQSMIAYQ